MMRGILAAVLLAVGAAGCAGSEPDPDRIVYMAIGASDAVGVGASPLTDGYVYRIADALEGPSADVALLNLGLPGAEIGTISDAVDVALEAGQRADLATLWVGANDVIGGRDVEDFEVELEHMLEQLRDETDAVIVIANLPDLTQLPRFVADPSPLVTRERIAAYNAAIARQAAAFDVPLVDLFGEAIETELVSDIDGFHPSNEGHRRIAERFLAVIRPALGIAAMAGTALRTT